MVGARQSRIVLAHWWDWDPPEPLLESLTPGNRPWRGTLKRANRFMLIAGVMVAGAPDAATTGSLRCLADDYGILPPQAVTP